MSGLSGTYLSLLMAIQENPLGTVTDLVQRVEGSKPTVLKRLSYLKKNNLFNVKALPQLHNLGLDSIDILVDTHNLKNVERIERVAEKHPYTSYRSRCYGSHNGVFLQFHTPIGTRGFIEELFDILENDGTIAEYKILSVGDEPTINSAMHLNGWDPKSMSWTFDWEKWFLTEYDYVKSKTRMSHPGYALEWLTRNDMYILQQLMLGAKRSNTDMIRSIRDKGVVITPQTFGRRFKMIDENCVETYRVGFNPMAFDIISNILISGKGTKKYLRRLYSKMSGDPIPFESTFRVSDSDLFWFVRMPASHLSSLLSNLHANLEDMTVTIIDYKQSFLYSIWPETLDEENYRWKQDREFMVDKALK